MSRILVGVVAALAAVSVSACGAVGKGKGKGKGPVVVEQPAAEPIYKD